MALLELCAPVPTSALGPFPHRARALDALYLASADFLRDNGQSVELATYDQRMATTAQAMGFDLIALDDSNAKG